MISLFNNWKKDLPASLVVYLVALPLCLGIALASTGDSTRLFSGIIAGIIGGVVIGSISGAKLGVSGPAAGLITIVSGAIATIGSFEGFLVALVLSGIIQLIASYLKAGVIGYYFPSAVIKGMLAAIGITLILKEIPHALGYDVDFMGDDAFFQSDQHNTISELFYALKALSPGAIVISTLSILILVLFDRPFMKRFGLFKLLPGALFVVLLGVGLNELYRIYLPNYFLSNEHLVSLPVSNNMKEFTSFFIFPDFSFLANKDVYIVALTIALVGSLETLLSVEAIDKLDPEKSVTPKNRELAAQGVGNVVSGLLGGLPITQVIVRSSANVTSGGKSKLSAIVHGVLLLITVIFIPFYLNLIPLASLSAILLMVGYKLSKVGLYKQMYRLGFGQFLPFIITILAVLFTDLLKGISIGIFVAILFILKRNYKNAYKKVDQVNEDGVIRIVLSEQITFINKGTISDLLLKLPNDSEVELDGSKCQEIDYDVQELIYDFKDHEAVKRNIKLNLFGIPNLM
jgi:MFS superfamily sulfate permease-like transporter